MIRAEVPVADVIERELRDLSAVDPPSFRRAIDEVFSP
jgi:hypothetical protein